MKTFEKILFVFVLALSLIFIFTVTADAEESVSFSLDSAECKINRSAEISVRARCSKKLCAAIFEFSYDNTLLEFSNVSASGEAKVLFNNEVGKLTVFYYCSQGADLSENTVLFTLKYKSAAEGDAAVSFTVRDCVDKNARFIKVGSCSAGHVSIGSSSGSRTNADKSSAAKSEKNKYSAKSSFADIDNDENDNCGNEQEQKSSTAVSIEDCGTADGTGHDNSNINIIIIICVSCVISAAIISFTVYSVKMRNKSKENE